MARIEIDGHIYRPCGWLGGLLYAWDETADVSAVLCRDPVTMAWRVWTDVGIDEAVAAERGGE